MMLLRPAPQAPAHTQPLQPAVPAPASPIPEQVPSIEPPRVVVEQPPAPAHVPQSDWQPPVVTTTPSPSRPPSQGGKFNSPFGGTAREQVPQQGFGGAKLGPTEAQQRRGDRYRQWANYASQQRGIIESAMRSQPETASSAETVRNRRLLMIRTFERNLRRTKPRDVPPAERAADLKLEADIRADVARWEAWATRQ